MYKLTAALVLGIRFAWAVVVSGLQTMRVILRSSAGVGSPAAAAFVRIRFAPIDARGATLLACMVTLTPGTTVIDIDMERREMLLHLLDGSDAAAAIAGIRREFEPGLLALFGEER